MGSRTKENSFVVPRLEDQLCFPLYACSKEIIRQYRKPLEKLNLTYTQYLVMMALWEYRSMSEGELGEKIRLESGTLAPLLKRLEKAGYVSRQRSADDERKLYLSLTEKGDRLSEEAKKIPQMIKGCISLSDDEMDTLKMLLDHALVNM